MSSDWPDCEIPSTSTSGEPRRGVVEGVQGGGRHGHGQAVEGLEEVLGVDAGVVRAAARGNHDVADVRGCESPVPGLPPRRRTP